MFKFMLLLRSSRSLARIAKFSDSAKCLSLNNKPCLARATLIDLNSNFIIIHLWVVQIDVIEVVILLMICQVEYMF